MKRSGIHAAVFISWVRRRSSPVFLRSSEKSRKSRCQHSMYAQSAPFSLTTLIDGYSCIILWSWGKESHPEIHHLFLWFLNLLYGCWSSRFRDLLPILRVERHRQWFWKLSGDHHLLLRGSMMRVGYALYQSWRESEWSSRSEAERADCRTGLPIFLCLFLVLRPIATRIQNACGEFLRFFSWWMKYRS